MKNTLKSTYAKATLLLLVSSSSMLALFGYLYFQTIKEEKKVYESSLNQFSNETDLLMNLKSELIEKVIYDVTLWTDHVDFIYDEKNNEKMAWFDYNIGSITESFGVDYVANYDINKNLIAEKKSDKYKGEIEIPIDFLNYAYKQKLFKFYYQSDTKVFEVYSSCIHPEDDPKKLDQPKGVLIFINQLKPEYFKELEQISGSEIKILDTNKSLIFNNNELVNIIPLKDFKGDAIKNMIFRRTINLNSNSSKEIIKIIVLFFLLTLLIIIIYYKIYIYNPLFLVTNVLKENRRSDINKLRKLSGEFGNIGDLFLENDNQKLQLISAKEKAEESDKLKSSFLTNLSHEIRTPMNAIIGFTDLMEDKKITSDEKLKYSKIIKRSGKNLVYIIDDLIKMSKIDTQQVKPNNTSFLIDDFIIDIKDTIAITIPDDSPVKLVLNLPKQKLANKLVSDEVKLRQVIINLLNNAIKFTKKGSITFGYSINNKENFIEFFVSDTGIGIDNKDFKNIFSRFHKIQTNENINQIGLGLGLSICKGYIEMLKGKIWVQSKKDVGTTFKFTLPLNLKSELKEEPKNTHAQDTQNTYNNITLLIAEDNDINFMLSKQILKSRNFNIIRAKNGQEAIDICKKDNSINLVLMDIKMPYINGIDANRAIKKFKPELPIIAHTAFSYEDEEKEIFKEGFVGCITKPLDKAKLFKCIDKVLNQTNLV